ncbi:MAG: Lrp/AsnC family transcriptional regulator [Clostridia bacterium]|nr:Lrp/AsnC family transcriptional regulator [Clostridia bacterium]MDE7214857.1 Lrp/AsnC family transcriptional regulator [Clostridia bacterium]
MEKLKRDILAVLAEDSRLNAAQIAFSLQADEKTVKKCIREMEEGGIIVKYTAIINADDLEEDAVEALIEVKVTPQRGHGFDMIAEEVAAHAEVQNLYLMSGAYDLAVIVRGKSLREISRFVSEKISTYDSVISTATHFILKKYKVEGAVMQRPEGGKRLSVQA